MTAGAKLKKKRGIGRRIELLVAASLFTALLLLSIFVSIFQFNLAIETGKHNAEAAAYVIASAAAEAVSTNRKEDVARVLSSASRLTDVIVVSALDKTGKTIATLGNRAVPTEELTTEDTSSWQAMFRSTLPVAVDIVKGGQTVGRIVMLTNVESSRNYALKILVGILTAALAAACAGILIARPILKRITEPLQQLTKTMSAIRTNRDFSSRVHHSADDETGQLAESFNELISDIEMRDEALQKVAYIDTLTGLPNRARFRHDVDDCINRKTSFSCVLMDVNKLQEINNSLGHAIGDHLLVEIAKLLSREAKSDMVTGVYRLDGDKFILFTCLNDTEQKTIEHYARFVSLFYKPLEIQGHEINVSFSAGAVLVPRDCSDVGSILSFLDLATTRSATHHGGAMVFFREEMHVKLRERSEMASALKLAIHQEEIDVYYQALVEVKSGRVQGFEALARWTREGQFVSPGVFIPLAEKSGLISDLGLSVLKKSCNQGRKWFEQSELFRQISVNVSAAQLIQASFVRDVAEALSESKLPAPLLCLELTESVFIGRTKEAVLQILKEVKKLGVSLALDDFGTGYSSLSYLEGLPFDKLKIDRSFLLGVHTSKKKLGMLMNMIKLAHDLDLQVVVEGAETLQDLNLLRELGADTVQGYVLSKPMPAEKALELADSLDDRAHGRISA